MRSASFLKYVLIVSVSVILIPVFSSRAYAFGQFGSQAINVLGQPDFNTVLNNRKGMASPAQIFVHSGKLYISDYSPNNRILVYNTIPTQNQQTPDFQIGQANLDSVGDLTVSASRLGYTQGIYTNGSKFFVADFLNNRVLIYNSLPTSSGASADIVIGQPDFTSNTTNNGGISAHSLYSPRGVWSDGTRLIVTDTYNNRILIWNTLPTVNNQDADIVLGQPSMTVNTANNGGISAHSIYRPGRAIIHNSKLYVADSSNNRVLIWGSIPTTNNEDADLVLGQPGFTTNTVNNGGVSAHSLSSPYYAFVEGTKMYLTDFNNNRVLIWNELPTVNNEDADVVVGQPNMTSNTANNGGISASSLYRPLSVSSDSTKLYIADYTNYRVLIYNTIPVSNGASADIVLGQPNFSSNLRFNVGIASARNYISPPSVYSNGSKLFISDSDRNRILVYNTIPTALNASADIVIGQPNMTSEIANNGGIGADTLDSPSKVVSNGTKLAITDMLNNRVLIFNNIPTSNGAPADVVVGQPDMVSNTINNGGRSASSLNLPQGSYMCGSRLVIPDTGNHRVLIYNNIPTSNGAAANLVLGQPDMVSGTVNNGGVSAHSLYYPRFAYCKDDLLIINDGTNCRVLIWTTFPTTNNEDADVVIGQQNFTSGGTNIGGVSASSLGYFYGIESDGTRLFVSDSYNNRVLIWNTLPTQNGQAADLVISQSNFTSNRSNGNGVVSNGSLSMPYGLGLDSKYLYVPEYYNHRVQIFALGPQNTSASLPVATSIPSVTLSLAADDAKEMMISSNSTFTGSSWEAFSSSKQLTLPSGDGTKTYYVKFKDYANYVGEIITVSTKLDTTSPSGGIVILSPESNGYTNSQTVTLHLTSFDSLSGVTEMKVSEDSTFTDVSWESFSSSKQLILSSGDGTKTVYVKYRDVAGNVSEVYGSSIILDTTVETSELILDESEGMVYDETTDSYVVETSTPTITGMGEPGSTVTISHEEEVLGKTTVKEDSHWSITLKNPLTNGTYSLDITIEDKAGNIVEYGLSITVKVAKDEDTQEPTDEDQPSTPGDKDDEKKEDEGFNIPIYCYLPLLLLIIISGAIYWYNKKRK